MFTVEHIGLAARNPESLKEWYVRVLGAEVAFAMQQTPPAYLLRLGSVMVEIYAADSSMAEVSNNRLAGWRHLALLVASLSAARTRLERAGVAFEEAERPAGGGGRVLFFKDPEGNLLHLVERLPAGFE